MYFSANTVNDLNISFHANLYDLYVSTHSIVSRKSRSTSFLWSRCNYHLIQQEHHTSFSFNT